MDKKTNKKRTDFPWCTRCDYSEHCSKKTVYEAPLGTAMACLTAFANFIDYKSIEPPFPPDIEYDAMLFAEFHDLNSASLKVLQEFRRRELWSKYPGHPEKVLTPNE